MADRINQFATDNEMTKTQAIRTLLTLALGLTDMRVKEGK